MAPAEGWAPGLGRGRRSCCSLCRASANLVVCWVLVARGMVAWDTDAVMDEKLLVGGGGRR